jgi:transcription elongation factor GreA
MIVTLSEALTQYIATTTNPLNSYAHQELHRFGRTVGLERDVETLAPPAVADYAEAVVSAGGDVHGRLAPLKEFLAYLKKHNFSNHSLAPHVKIPRATQRAMLASRAAEQQIPMTKEGKQLLQDEMDGIKSHRNEVIDAIRLAAADGDFKENAPLDAAREVQGKAEARVRELEETIRRSVILDPKVGKGVRVGSVVVLQDLGSGKNVTYKLTDSASADPLGGKISIVSPVGEALMGHNPGEEISVQTPKGERKYILSTIK